MQNDYNIHIGAMWYGDVLQGWIEANRRIYDYEMVFFSCGRCRVITKDKTFLCDEGTVIVIPPNYEHYTVCDTFCTRWCIHFDWYGDCPLYRSGRQLYVQWEKENFEPAYCAREYPADQMRFPAHFKIRPENFALLLTLFRNFFNILPNSFSKCLQRDGIFLQILGIVMSETDKIPEKKGGNSIFFIGKNILDQRFPDAGIEIRQIAAELLITPNHFNKLFHQYLGISPSSYLLNRRLFYAESLLRDTRKTINEISESCGFSDANYFIRCFKKKHGMTPKKYRNSRS